MPISRPPKKWFDTCTSKVKPTRPLKKKTVKQSKSAICGFIWKNISTKTKQKIRRNNESFKK